MQIVKGNFTNFTHIQIDDEDANQHISPNIEDTLVAEYDWLTVKFKEHSDALIVSAKPTSSHKKREAWIYAYSGPKYVEIKVTQQGR